MEFSDQQVACIVGPNDTVQMEYFKTCPLKVWETIVHVSSEAIIVCTCWVRDRRAANSYNSSLWFLSLSRGPDGVQLEKANTSVATVTGLQVGTYVFTLTVKDERNLQSQSSVNVIVKEGTSLPRVVAAASGLDNWGIHHLLFGCRNRFRDRVWGRKLG